MQLQPDGTTILTLFLGFYYAASGLGGLLDPGRWQHLVREMEASPYNQLTGGLLALAAGGILVGIADPADGWLGALLFAFGILATIKGVCILVAPGPLLRMSRAFTGTVARPVSGIIFLMGLALIAAALASQP